MLTLTGWAALAGVFALAAVVLSLAVFAARRFCGVGGGPSRRGYTMVVKQELAERGGAGASPGHLPRRQHV